MKYKNLFLLTILLFTVSIIQAQVQLPNPDFENWDDDYHATDWNSYDFLYIYHTAEQTNDASHGNSAVKLETQSVYGMGEIPGLILLGEIDMETYMPEGGVPFTGRPTGISFDYKYAPEPNDSMLMVLMMTKWNEGTNSRDTIAGAIFTQDEEVATYTKTIQPIFYQSPEEPDTINLGFISSGQTPVAGSVLYVDSITMKYEFIPFPTICLPAVNITPSSFTAIWLPLPITTSYFIDVADDPDFTTYLDGYENLQLFGLLYETFLDIEDIETSIYYYRIRVNYGTEVSDNSNVIAVPLPTITTEAANITHNSFTANWDAVDNATNYRIDLATDENFENFVPEYENRETGLNNSIDISNLNSETEYFYRIRVEYNEHTSINSNISSLSTDIFEKIKTTENKLFNIFSNNGTILITKNYTQDALAQIFDLSGKIIAEKNITATNTEINIYRTGLYIVKIISDNNTYTTKVIVY